MKILRRMPERLRQRLNKERKRDVEELRKYLPKVFNKVSDEDLHDAYAKYSEDFYCAGWLGPEGGVQTFLEHHVLQGRWGRIIDPNK